MDYSKYTKQELLRLLEVKERRPGRTPGKIYDSIAKYGLKDQEHFLVVSLDGQLNIIKVHVVTKGIVNRTMVHPREVFRPAIADNATSIVVAHNHPSNNLTASVDDIETTQALIKAGRIIGIQILDHIILGVDNCSSMKELGEVCFD